jgi:hypothetical protein
MRAALAVNDNPLADYHTEQLFIGPDAKKVFASMRSQYALHGREMDFREIQRQAALQRIHHHEEDASEGG